jgi:hypothetical protein
MITRFVVLLALAPICAPPQDGEMGEARKYRILYAGLKGDAREERFVKLLKERFDKVDSIGLQSLSAEAANGYDVVVADWGRRYKGKGFSSENSPKLQLSPNFARPIVMIGAVAGEIQRRTKINWL